MNSQGPRHSISVLKRVVAVIPRRAILDSPEAVSVGFTRCNGALRHAVDAIHLQALKLAYTMPMDSCSIELEFVLDSDLCSHK